ncbi:nitrate reductase cytochrome c-type subunit [Psychromonas sp. CD1]|uniref:nitrate reductase cytochrome c-type subunit n=1 Tax=Psychromonas sp. CD1 TaxID=1979839 RepID=UPI000B9B0C68|nr:nitrate reductase cytochrome c-type subunit [Psychromonas sp. CD1]
MKKRLIALCIATLITFTALPAMSVTQDLTSNNGGVRSLRGLVEISTTNKSEMLKRVPREQTLIDRNYVQQPPIIPHSTRGYYINLNVNKCLSCHSFKNAGEMDAPKISVTHFEARDGMMLSDVSPRRYFCLQCHVTQVAAKPLVKNTFQPVKSLQ